MGDQYLPMNSWAADELPREKLLTKGVAALSISELFAILLRSGVGGETALELARRILADNNNDLNQLARRSVRELINKYKVSAGQLSRMRKNDDISTHTINMLCEILDCRVEDIVVFEKE